MPFGPWMFSSIETKQNGMLLRILKERIGLTAFSPAWLNRAGSNSPAGPTESRMSGATSRTGKPASPVAPNRPISSGA